MSAGSAPTLLLIAIHTTWRITPFLVRLGLRRPRCLSFRFPPFFVGGNSRIFFGGPKKQGKLPLFWAAAKNRLRVPSCGGALQLQKGGVPSGILVGRL